MGATSDLLDTKHGQGAFGNIQSLKSARADKRACHAIDTAVNRELAKKASRIEQMMASCHASRQAAR